MADEDVKMEDADGGSVEAEGQQPQSSSKTGDAAGEEGERDAENENEALADATCGAGAGSSGGGAVAQIPAAKADGAADTATTAPASGAATGGKKAAVERPTREDPAAIEKLRAYVATLGMYLDMEVSADHAHGRMAVSRSLKEISRI
jgi:hypothetical protein